MQGLGIQYIITRGNLRTKLLKLNLNIKTINYYKSIREGINNNFNMGGIRKHLENKNSDAFYYIKNKRKGENEYEAKENRGMWND